MFKTKYITFDNGLIDTIIVFPEFTQHSHISIHHSNILGAGFIDIMEDGSWKCFGESISLNVKSRPEDTKIANEQFPKFKR